MTASPAVTRQPRPHGPRPRATSRPVASLPVAHILQQGVRAVVGALFFWALAVYGALTVVRQVSRGLRRRIRQNLHPVAVVLIVQNSEAHIEGVLRSIFLSTSMGRREWRILVFDMGSTDDTPHIVQRLAMQHDGLEYVRIEGEGEFVQHLARVCAEGGLVGCIYDLRVSGMLCDVARDIRLLCG